MPATGPGTASTDRAGHEGPGWFGGSYGGGAQEFFRILKAWRDEGSLEGLELS